MALTKAQVEAIQRAQKKAVAQRAAIQKTKISDSEARKASSTMHKRAGGSPSYTLKDTSVLSKSELASLGKTAKANAAQEKTAQKHRAFAKGEGKLPVKQRVGTKAEYKQLGKEIQTRKQLIAYGKAARAAQAERAKNPVAAKEAKPVATKKTTPAKTTAKKAAPAPKALVTKKAAAPKAKSTLIKGGNLKEVTVKGKKVAVNKTSGLTPKEITKMAVNEQKMNEPTSTPKTTKASTTAIKKRTSPNTKKSTPKVKTPKLQTLEEAKAKAPTPKGPMEGPAKPIKGPLADQPRFFPGPQTPKAAEATGKVASAKKALASTKVAKTAKAVSQTTAAKTIANSKVAKVASKAGKVVKIGARVAQGVGVVKETGQVFSGQAEKDFRRIQALENRIAVAKGEKPKYTTTGSNKNLLSSVKTDLGNAAKIVTGGIVGKSRKDRLEELKQTLAKVQKKTANKPAAKPAPKSATPVITTPGGQKVGGNASSSSVTGNKYTVKKGDTLSAIASRSGVSLKELRAANPKFTAQAKYKNGNTIFSGTTVSIPKKKAK